MQTLRVSFEANVHGCLTHWIWEQDKWANVLARGSGQAGPRPGCTSVQEAPRAKPGKAFCCLVVVVLSGVWFARSSQAFGHAGPSPAPLLLLLAATAACVVVVVVVVVVAAVVLVLCPCPCQALVIVGKYDIKSFFEAWNLEG